MANFIDGAEMTHAQWVRAMRHLEDEGNREYCGRPLVRIGDVLVTAETAADLEVA